MCAAALVVVFINRLYINALQSVSQVLKAENRRLLDIHLPEFHEGWKFRKDLPRDCVGRIGNTVCETSHRYGPAPP
jgi:hypothetical protein